MSTVVMSTDNKSLNITVRCRICRTEHPLVVNLDGYLSWKYEGQKIQNALPDLSPENRELLISEICPKCWTNLFEGR